MKENFILFQEEKKNAHLFLWVFNIVWISYEIVYSIILKDSGSFVRPYVLIPKFVYGVGLIGFSVYLMKKKKADRIKHVYLIAYMCAESFNLYWYAMYNKVVFDDGNVMEFVFIFFVSIFMSKRYFLWLSSIIMGKYIMLIFVLGDKQAFMPLIMYGLLLFVSYLLLNRFLQYLSTINDAMTAARESEKSMVIGKMAASVGHEIRNPLSSLKGFTQLQKEKHADDKAYEYMIDEIEHINNMVSKLMAIAACKRSIYSSQFIGEVVSNAMNEMKQDIKRKQLQLVYDTESDQIKIECDNRKLKEVFLYVLKNAIESMEHGGTLCVHIKEKDEDYVIVSIIDSGCGIQEENLNRITEAFYTTKKDGIGLGLTVARKLIEEHQGEMQITSEKNVGTKVDIILPKEQNEE